MIFTIQGQIVHYHFINIEYFSSLWYRSRREHFSYCPMNNNKEHREILFLKETNEHIAIWEGEKLTKEKARQFQVLTLFIG